jgi:nitrile hydratase subunit beta
MDGIHDLGGRVGFGPIDVTEPEEQFHHTWEARALAIIRAMTRPVPWSIDWFREVRELIDPVDYLTRPYYDQWIQSYAAMLVHAGAASVEELALGKSNALASDRSRPMGPQDVSNAKGGYPKFSRELTAGPRFAVGDNVRAKLEASVGHTRLPQYVRGRPGSIEAYRGGFVFPDTNATDDAHAAPLYTVAFAAADLWPEGRGSQDHVFVDLWESYLEPA